MRGVGRVQEASPHLPAPSTHSPPKSLLRPWGPLLLSHIHAQWAERGRSPASRAFEKTLEQKWLPWVVLRSCSSCLNQGKRERPPSGQCQSPDGKIRVRIRKIVLHLPPLQPPPPPSPAKEPSNPRQEGIINSRRPTPRGLGPLTGAERGR